VAIFLLAGLVVSFATQTIWWEGGVLAAIIGAEVYRTFETNILSAARRQRPAALWQAIDAWARPVFAIGMVWLIGPSAIAVISGYLFATIALTLLFRLLLTESDITEQANVENDPGLSKEIADYAWPLVPLAFVSWLTTVSDRYIVGMFLDLESVGIYAATFALASRPIVMLNGVLTSAIRPAYYQAVADGHTEESQGYVALWCTITALTSFVLIGALTFFRREIVNLLLAKEYQGSADLLPIVACGNAVMAFAQPFNTVSLAYKRPIFVVISEATSGVANVLFGFPLIWALGLTGAALMVPVRYVFQFLSACYLAGRARRK
jgi:O-antigen/teichoic acid export membrane protein